MALRSPVSTSWVITPLGVVRAWALMRRAQLLSSLPVAAQKTAARRSSSGVPAISRSPGRDLAPATQCPQCINGGGNVA